MLGLKMVKIMFHQNLQFNALIRTFVLEEGNAKYQY